MQCPSWEANRFSVIQEIPHILWNPKVHYRTHKCLQSLPILSQIDPVHDITYHSQKIHLNIILPSAPGSSKWYISFRFTTNILFPYCYMPRLSHFLDLITRITSGEEYGSWNSSLCSFHHSPVTSSLLAPRILLSTLFSNTPSQCSSLNLSYQVSHPYNTTNKI